MDAATILRYLLTFLSGFIVGGAVVYEGLRYFLAGGVGRAMPFRDEPSRQTASVARTFDSLSR